MIRAALAVLLCGILWMWRRGMRPAANILETPAELANAITFLIRRGVDGAKLRIYAKDEHTCVVSFTKYVEDDRIGVKGLCAPSAATAERHSLLLTDMEERHILFTKVASAAEPGIEVECRRDVGLAVMFTMLALQHIAQTTLGEQCVAYFDRVLISDHPEMTGFREETPSS